MHLAPLNNSERILKGNFRNTTKSIMALLEGEEIGCKIHHSKKAVTILIRNCFFSNSPSGLLLNQITQDLLDIADLPE